jgi:transposase
VGRSKKKEVSNATHVQIPSQTHKNPNRPIPTGFTVKTGTVIREADGWYISLTLEDKTVPVTVAEIQPTNENTVGIDLGIINYAHLSNGERVENPKLKLILKATATWFICQTVDRLKVD